MENRGSQRIISGVKDMDNQQQTTWLTHGKRDIKKKLFILISQKGDENTGNNHYNRRSQGHGELKTNHLIMTHSW